VKQYLVKAHVSAGFTRDADIDRRQKIPIPI